MEHTLTETVLALESSCYRGTAGVSQYNRRVGFHPAFIDHDTGAVYLARFPDGRHAPCHLLDGPPDELVLARSEKGRVTRGKGSVVSGFVYDERFYTRDDAAAMPVSVLELGRSQRATASLRRAA